MSRDDRRGRRWVGGVTAVAVGLFAAAVPSADAVAASRRVCVPFEATGAGQDQGGGQTVGVISVAGRRVATSRATFTITGVAGGIASFTGPLVLVPDALPDASLTAQLDGTFDVTPGTATSGDFTATSTSVTGSGPLAPVTGRLRVLGVEDLTTGSFTEDLRGRLCIPVGRRPALESVVG